MEALDEGIDWCFETFPEYLAALDRRPKRLNVGAFVGHSTLRLFVLGGEERPATDDEVATMRGLVREAMQHGAIGFSTSRQPNHQGAFGRPVPSRFADVDEIYALTSVLGDLGKGVVEVSIGPGLVARPVLGDGGALRRAGDVDRARRRAPTSPAPRCARSTGARRCRARCTRRSRAARSSCR